MVVILPIEGDSGYPLANHNAPSGPVTIPLTATLMGVQPKRGTQVEGGVSDAAVPLVVILPIWLPANHSAPSGPAVMATGFPGIFGNSVITGVDCAQAQLASRIPHAVHLTKRL
jgi:hypothetical protein